MNCGSKLYLVATICVVSCIVGVSTKLCFTLDIICCVPTEGEDLTLINPGSGLRASGSTSVGGRPCMLCVRVSDFGTNTGTPCEFFEGNLKSVQHVSSTRYTWYTVALAYLGVLEKLDAAR